MILMMGSFLNTAMTEILFTFNTKTLYFLTMCFAKAKSVNFIDCFKFMSVHQFGFMMVSTAVIAEEKVFSFAVGSWDSVLAIAAFVV